MKNTYHIKVRWGDTDAATIVYYPNFYKWMDEATHEFFEAAGYSTPALQKNYKIQLPLLEASCTFKAPLKHNDKVQVITFIEEINRKVLRFRHEFIKENSVIAIGYEKRAWTTVENDQMKAVPVPDFIKEALTTQ
ncbi:acyl-CoA thioesterase [Bacillus sp. FJAT-44742]|uniref:acyl-CoA thioesterase n=1 Tax=Bacillus sp. FJAT-44742 TaxID=2014005 RepID=UPI000C2361CF|nr:thioesterase family protein [Bacillus sp. FJAT-44742]